MENFEGLVKSCPYLQMDGAAHDGLYLLSLNREIFSKLFSWHIFSIQHFSMSLSVLQCSNKGSYCRCFFLFS